MLELAPFDTDFIPLILAPIISFSFTDSSTITIAWCSIFLRGRGLMKVGLSRP